MIDLNNADEAATIRKKNWKLWKNLNLKSYRFKSIMYCKSSNLKNDSIS